MLEMSQPVIAGSSLQLQNVTINVVGGDQVNCKSPRTSTEEETALHIAIGQRHRVLVGS